MRRVYAQRSVRPVAGRAAGVANRFLGVHQGYHLVVLGDDLSWLERRVVDCRCNTTEPAEDRFLAFERSGVRVGVGIAGTHLTHSMSSAITSASAAMSPRPKASYALWTRRVFSSVDTGTLFEVSEDYLTRGDSVHNGTVWSRSIPHVTFLRPRYSAATISFSSTSLNVVHCLAAKRLRHDCSTSRPAVQTAASSAWRRTPEGISVSRTRANTRIATNECRIVARQPGTVMGALLRGVSMSVGDAASRG